MRPPNTYLCSWCVRNRAKAGLCQRLRDMGVRSHQIACASQISFPPRECECARHCVDITNTLCFAVPAAVLQCTICCFQDRELRRPCRNLSRTDGSSQEEGDCERDRAIQGPQLRLICFLSGRGCSCDWHPDGTCRGIKLQDYVGVFPGMRL